MQVNLPALYNTCVFVFSMHKDKTVEEELKVHGRFYARDVNVVSDVKAASRRLKRLL